MKPHILFLLIKRARQRVLIAARWQMARQRREQKQAA